MAARVKKQARSTFSQCSSAEAVDELRRRLTNRPVAQRIEGLLRALGRGRGPQFFAVDGDLRVEGDYVATDAATLVRGNLTIDGSLEDGGDWAYLFVLGDLRVASRALVAHTIVVTGSLLVDGILYASSGGDELVAAGKVLRAEAVINAGHWFHGRVDSKTKWLGSAMGSASPKPRRADDLIDGRFLVRDRGESQSRIDAPKIRAALRADRSIWA